MVPKMAFRAQTQEGFPKPLGRVQLHLLFQCLDYFTVILDRPVVKHRTVYSNHTARPAYAGGYLLNHFQCNFPLLARL
jgi:hypothetical protein